MNETTMTLLIIVGIWIVLAVSRHATATEQLVEEAKHPGRLAQREREAEKARAAKIAARRQRREARMMAKYGVVYKEAETILGHLCIVLYFAWMALCGYVLYALVRFFLA